MIERILNLSTINFLERGLDAASLRHQVLSNNIANVSTPGFKRSDVVFEEVLAAALGQGEKTTLAGVRTDAKHLPIGSVPIVAVQPQLVRQEDTSLRNDGNNVDIDVEMAELAKNTIYYEALSRQIGAEIAKLKYVISEGRR
ncbi:flagellar basal-body rod protein FlgB [Carboxydocella thermautotrophica]|nr:flagellar basal-body rod protein FlgB [Carboxydocella thermautotrophica]